MAEIDVTTEALSHVRMALKKFQTDTEYFPNNVRNHISKLKEDCDWALHNVKQRLQELTDGENEIRKQIDIKKKQCDDLKSECDSCRTKYEQYDNECIRCMCERGALEEELQRQRDAIEEELQSQIQRYGCIIDEKTDSRIGFIENKIRCLDITVSTCKHEMVYHKNAIDKCSSEIKWIESEIQQAEEDLRKVEWERHKTEDKLKRLRKAYFSVMQEADNFSAAVNKFSRRALEVTEGNISGINQSMKLVEKYMSTNL